MVPPNACLGIPPPHHLLEKGFSEETKEVGAMHPMLDLNGFRASPVPLTAVPLHPVKVFLGRLGPGSRTAQKQALDTIAGLLSSGCSDCEGLNWASLRYSQTAAVRAVLVQRYA